MRICLETHIHSFIYLFKCVFTIGTSSNLKLLFRFIALCNPLAGAGFLLRNGRRVKSVGGDGRRGHGGRRVKTRHLF